MKIKILSSLVAISGNIEFKFTEKSQYFIGKHIRNDVTQWITATWYDKYLSLNRKKWHFQYLGSKLDRTVAKDQTVSDFVLQRMCMCVLWFRSTVVTTEIFLSKSHTGQNKLSPTWIFPTDLISKHSYLFYRNFLPKYKFCTMKKHQYLY